MGSIEFHPLKGGHIIHLNLREELLPYQFVLGKILLDKINKARTVVNKLDKLNTEFRVMDMELLAGEADFKTQVVEHGITYKLDYSKVLKIQ
jgi:tRNA (guanine37-N1)-methyltransferase